MKKSQLGLLGSLLATGALAIAGCGGGSSGGGTGGKADAGGTGGKGGVTGGVGGKLGTGGGGAGGVATDGGTDVKTGAGGSSMDGGTDTGDTGPCTTSVGAGNRLLFSFDNGLNVGWFAEVQSVGYTFGSTKTDGDRCPGAISLTINYTSISNPNDDVVYRFGTPDNWTGFSKLHASIKLVASNYTAISGVQPFFQTNNNGSYSNGGFASGSTFANGRFHEIVLDMLNPGYTQGTVMFNSISSVGIQIVLATATDGGPSTPGDVQLLVDDVWLEAAPATDAGMDTSADVPADTGTDVPPADTGVDLAPADTNTGTGTDTAPTDATVDATTG